MSATEVERLARRAGFVFAGEVVRTGATTMELVEPTKETAVVRVERVLSSPEDLGAERGSEVTVGLQPAGDVDAMEKQMGDARRKDELAALRRRVREADAVVVGEVADTKPVARKDQPPTSEHDPLWHTAVVVVESGEKGDVKEGQRVDVAYAASDDVMWFRAPKPKQGDRAIFLMHRRGLEERNVEMLTIVEPVDM